MIDNKLFYIDHTPIPKFLKKKRKKLKPKQTNQTNQKEKMSLKIKFSETDILASAKLEAGIYKLKVLDVSAAPGKKDPESTTFVVSLAVAEGPNINVPVQAILSSKMMKGLTEFISCFVDKIDPTKDYDLEQTKGKTVTAYVVHNLEYKNNEVKDFVKG